MNDSRLTRNAAPRGESTSLKLFEFAFARGDKQLEFCLEDCPSNKSDRVTLGIKKNTNKITSVNNACHSVRFDVSRSFAFKHVAPRFALVLNYFSI